MGTINYRTGDFITLCYEGDDDFAIEAVYNRIQAELDCARFTEGSFIVTLEYGYYEGFSITVDEGDYSYYDDSDEKADEYKTVKALEEFLNICIRMGMVVCYPGWCMGYENTEGTKKVVKKALHNVRQYIKAVPTWRTYRRLKYATN